MKDRSRLLHLSSNLKKKSIYSMFSSPFSLKIKFKFPVKFKQRRKTLSTLEQSNNLSTQFMLLKCKYVLPHGHNTR